MILWLDKMLYILSYIIVRHAKITLEYIYQYTQRICVIYLTENAEIHIYYTESTVSLI